MSPTLAPLLTALSLVLAACGGAGAGTEATRSGDDAPVTFVTSVFPLAWMAEQVAPDADVTLLASSGQDPHDLELSPAQRAQIESADVVAFMGDLDFQPQVESAVGAAAGQVLSVVEVAGSDVRHVQREIHADDEHADDAHADDAHSDQAHSDDEVVDPHLWFDADVMAEVAEELGEAFAAADEANAHTYRANAGRLHDDLVALDGEIDAVLAGCEHDTALVSHEAYGYLLEPRGLEQEGISGAGGHAEASPQRLAELTARIRAEGITAVLAEPVEGRADAEALAREADVEILEIDPLEIADQEQFETGYLELLRTQAARFAEALACE